MIVLLANEILDSIKEASDIALFPHIKADGDAIGATLGLYHVLKAAGKKVAIFVEEEPQFLFEFLPGIKDISLYLSNDENQLSREFELAIAVDTSDIERLGKRFDLFKKAKTTINIDHHPTNTNFAEYNHVVSSAAAAGEIIFDLIKKMKYKIDEDVATCIYAAISFDTGGFRFANTNEQTHLAASELIACGARASEVSINLFENITLERLKIMGEMSKALELYGKGKIAVISISREIVERTGASEEDLDGLSNIGRSIRGVEVAISIRSKGPKYHKVSMRARNEVDLCPIAAKYGGGGHKRAAGFEYNGEAEIIKDLLVKEFLSIL